MHFKSLRDSITHLTGFSSAFWTSHGCKDSLHPQIAENHHPYDSRAIKRAHYVYINLTLPWSCQHSKSCIFFPWKQEGVKKKKFKKNSCFSSLLTEYWSEERDCCHGNQVRQRFLLTRSLSFIPIRVLFTSTNLQTSLSVRLWFTYAHIMSINMQEMQI